MTENEKLRALLAEARMYLTMNGGSVDDRIVRSIDAALAEPVVDWRKAHGDAIAELSKATDERDEARAEVERLRKAVHTRACRNQSAYNLECVCGADEHQRDLQKLAYQRGAEAMREAAARLVDEMLSHTLTDAADRIRALPICENDP